MKPPRTKAATIADVAAKAGVSAATVSYVLNAAQSRIPISEKTRQRVLRAVRECGYHPNAAARALSRHRTGHLGFILSDALHHGWSNLYFSAALGGVEKACRERDYGLSISLYNLSNIETFVFPARVGQRAVDGVVLTGYVQAAVVRRFQEFGVPCVCIGDNVEVAELIPTIGPDVIGGLMKAVAHLAGQGHRRIYCHFEPSRRGREVAELLQARVAEGPLTRDCAIQVIDFRFPADHRAGRPLIDHWLSLLPAERPTAVISNEQVLPAFQREMRREGLSCPGDLSMLSNCDTLLCEFADPPLTALRQDFDEAGRIAVGMLIDHIEAGKPLGPELSRTDCSYELVLRASCGTAPE